MEPPFSAHLYIAIMSGIKFQLSAQKQIVTDKLKSTLISRHKMLLRI